MTRIALIGHIGSTTLALAERLTNEGNEVEIVTTEQAAERGLTINREPPPLDPDMFKIANFPVLSGREKRRKRRKEQRQQKKP